MKKKMMKREIVIPQGVTVTFNDKTITVKGKNGELSKELYYPNVKMTVEDGKFILQATNVSKADKMYLGTFRSHLINMFAGATRNYVYTLKVCSGHFPMTVGLSGKKFEVKNFLGEKVPRVLIIKEGANVKVEGDKITVSSCNKELSGQVAADIELLTRITNRDRRIFQDGIYITLKDGKEI
jgi:large subunit ribosomal protein L6